MLRRYCALLFLFAPLEADGQVTLYEQLDRPFVALFDLPGHEYTQRDMKLLRSAVKQERNEHLHNCRNDEKRMGEQLHSARAALQELNASSPEDNHTLATARGNIHNEISAFERAIRERRHECEHSLPAAFEIKLAKVDLLYRWPRQHEQTVRTIDAGLARTRKHGDVDDIGYRKSAEDQEKDISVGQQAAAQMAFSKLMPKEVQDGSVRGYVQELAATLARHSDLKVPLHVTLLDSPEISAIGLPGGFLFVTSGLLLACETESELAGVLSQQIAHIAARHATRASKRSFFAKMFVPAAQIATGLVSGGISNVGTYYGMNYGFQGLGLLVDRALLSSNEKGLKEADQLGIQYAWKAGFDPKGFIVFLDSLAKEKDFSRTGRFILTKPPLNKRLLNAFAEIRFLPPRNNYTIDSAAFRAARERINRASPIS